MSFELGVVAALSAPFVMVLGFIVWENQWVGTAFALNLFKCTLASFGFLVFSLTTRSSGDIFPSDIFTRTSVGYLMLSATIGILLGDWVWLEGLKLIGARRVIVIDSCKPFLAALFGWAILGERLKPAAFGGMALTVTGVLIVSLETKKELDEDVPDETEKTEEMKVDDDSSEVLAIPHGPLATNDEEAGETVAEDATKASKQDEEMVASTATETDNADSDSSIEEQKSKKNEIRRRTRRGYVMAFTNVVLDTYGSLLTKEHGAGMTTWEINLIRFGFSAACMLALSLIMHARHFVVVRGQETKKEDQDASTTPDEEVDDNKDTQGPWYSLPRNMTRMAWLKVSMGVGLVTFLTPALSNYALFQIALALALTLGSVGPLYALPLTWLLQHDRPTLRACLGGILAVAGIAVLSLLGKEQQ